MAYEVILLKERPDIAKIVRCVDPNYRKHKVCLFEHTKAITPQGTYWDGGSRSSYHHVDKYGGVSLVPAPTAPPQFGGGRSTTFEIPEGGAVVSLGTFRGKKKTASVYLNN